MSIREATLIQGDGIGPEITQATLQVLDALGMQFDWDEQFGGMAAVEKAGTPLPNATLDSIRHTKLCLKGPLTTGAFTTVGSNATYAMDNAVTVLGPWHRDVLGEPATRFLTRVRGLPSAGCTPPRRGVVLP